MKKSVIAGAKSAQHNKTYQDNLTNEKTAITRAKTAHDNKTHQDNLTNEKTAITTAKRAHDNKTHQNNLTNEKNLTAATSPTTETRKKFYESFIFTFLKDLCLWYCDYCGTDC